MELSDIKSVYVHWSESSLINKELSHVDGDINKEVDIAEFDDLVRRAAALVGPGYDKTCLTVTLQDGTVWGKNGGCKFYLVPGKDSLLKLLDEA